MSATIFVHAKNCKSHEGESCDCVPRTIKTSLDPIIIVPPTATLPTGYDERKALPLASVVDYFPLAFAAVSRVIAAGQKQHGTVGWDRAKSQDEANTLLRHFMDRGALDSDGVPHSAKVAWRALALLEKEEEQRLGMGISRGSYDSSKGQKGPGE